MAFGRLAAILAEVYPAGAVNEKSLVTISMSWIDGKKDKKTLAVDIACDEDTLGTESFIKAVSRLEKLGKKKNWPGGLGGCKIVTSAHT